MASFWKFIRTGPMAAAKLLARSPRLMGLAPELRR
ncbi:hypothetical protein ACVIIW_006843 [Bradyrhizobium sp. USDA 4449]